MLKAFSFYFPRVQSVFKATERLRPLHVVDLVFLLSIFNQVLMFYQLETGNVLVRVYGVSNEQD